MINGIYRMKLLKIIFLTSFSLFFLMSCTGNLPVQITPVLSAIKSDGVIKKPITMGYIPLSLNKEETFLKVFYMTFGAGVYELKLAPYRDSHPLFKKVLRNVYKNSIPITNQNAPFASNANIKYLISINDIKIESGEELPGDLSVLFTILVPSAGTIYPQYVYMSFWCKIIDRSGKIIMHKKFKGLGQATKTEINRGGNTITVSRAFLSAFNDLQKDLVKLELPQ